MLINDKHNRHAPPLLHHRWLTAALLCAPMLGAAPVFAADEPAQKPLLSSQTGAKPNLMIALDNSGSMAFSFHETYGVTSGSSASDDYEIKRCPSNRYGSDGNLGGPAVYSNSLYSCYNDKSNRGVLSNLRDRTSVVTSYSPARWTAKWSAQRSADVNPIYYNPRITYRPRVDSNGVDLVPNDNVVFVSNQDSTNAFYRAFRNDSNRSLVRSRHSFYADDTNSSTMSGWTQYTWTGTSDYYVPRHVAYTDTNSSTPSFTYVNCADVVSSGGLQVDCASPQRVNITPTSPASITLPADHNRTEDGCTGNTCTHAAEVKNILNWYRYYGFRAPAVATAIGQALANPEYDGKLRIGYLNINARSNTTVAAITETPGVDTSSTGLLRGVRVHQRGASDANTVYSWLYGQDGARNRDTTIITGTNRNFIPHGGTPLHNALDKVATYYSATSGERAWAKNPTAGVSTSNPEMTCRRSFALLFSDGAWNSGTSTNSTEYDNENGPTFTRTGTSTTFSYRPQGVNTEAGRKQYVPYPSTATQGLADLTAKYFWHTDLRNNLANEVVSSTGQPTFWQNMATYTVGYMIRPSGDVPGATSGLTFEQIKNYQTRYATVGWGTSATNPKPSWPTGNLNSATSSDQNRVDDFIQAGYTGGGRGFSAQSADDVREIFNTVLADILNAAGRDAGVAVSTDATNTSTIAGRLKYSVSYKTINNTGDIVAQRLDADGNAERDADGQPMAEWTASKTIPDPDDRKVFTITGDDTGVEFKGNFSSLDTDVQAALRHGPDASRIANDASFVDYLRGKDPVADADGVLFRQRESKIGAMVNPPSIYMGASRDFAYDLSGSVDGSSSYLAYIEAKQSLPASLLVATNAGVVHNLDALDGTELAAFMPRRSLKRMLDYAKDSYKFEYILDGPLSEHDIYDGSDWNHLAVGTGGRGEKLIYGLRSPLNKTGGNREPGAQDFLWEQGADTLDTTDFKLGHMTQPARSGQTEDGTWVAVLNSGHYNGEANGRRHGLVLLNPMTGELVRRIALPSSADAGRGLSGVTLVRNEDKRIVAAYAGDAAGNLWRFDLRGSKESWKVSYGKPLFTGPRPIYSAPAWQAHPKGGNIVVVATGMLMDDDDLTDTAANAIYGIWDPTVLGEDDESLFTTVTPSQLVVQSIDTSVTPATTDNNTYNRTTRNQINWATHRGWTFALGHTHAGERSLDQIRNVGTSVFINTTVIAPQANPEDEMCTASGLPLNYIYGFRAVDGATQYSFDVDGDGKLDNVSMVLVGGGGYSRGMALANLYDNPTNDSVRNSLRERLGIDGGAGESEPTPQKCSNIKKAGLGTEDGSIGLGVYCPVAGWSRTQFQLSTPPRN